MAAQAGIWHFDEKPVGDDLKLINSHLAGFGPDGEATYRDADVQILYRPFHTTTESRIEHQPYTSESGTVFTWNGRLDNREELICSLKHKLNHDISDVALVGAAFDYWGINSFAKLAGDWGLTAWNKTKRELILARDYIGIRHLYYYLVQNKVMWCSHLAPLALGVDRLNLSEEYVASHINLWPEAHLTPYREIRAVPPGSFITVRKQVASIQTYWVFNPKSVTRHDSDEGYEQQFRYLFRQSVRRRLRTNAPILADLSGGLDSSSVVCMADDILAKEGAATPRLDTFSLFLRDEPGEEDSFYLAMVEEKRGRPGHHIELCSSASVSLFTFPRFAPTPGFHGRPEENASKSELIKRGNYRVILSGVAGDEMLGQTIDPRIQLADLLRKCNIPALTKGLYDWSLLLRRPAIQLLCNAASLQLPTGVRVLISHKAQVEPWITRTFSRKHHLAERQLDAAEGPWLWTPGIRDWHQTVMTLSREVSKIGPYSFEVRYPFLDQQLVEFLTSIPLEQSLRPGQRRSLMRRALANLLPPQILERRTKSSITRYFSVVLEKHWAEIEVSCRTPLIAHLGYVDQKTFYQSLIDAKNGKLSPHFLRLFRALSLELWLRDVLSRGVISI